MDFVALEVALKNIDWEQVVQNGGPPCFFLDDGPRFCLRAKRWDGHGIFHSYISLEDLVNPLLGDLK